MRAYVKTRVVLLICSIFFHIGYRDTTLVYTTAWKNIKFMQFRSFRTLYEALRLATSTGKCKVRMGLGRTQE